MISSPFCIDPGRQLQSGLAIAFKEGTVKYVNFAAETKGSMSIMELREIEQSKIKCARKFFASITSDQVKYDAINGYDKLMELVR